MNKVEITRLLAIASVLDARTVTDPTVNLWHELIGHLDYSVAHAALLEHMRESTFPVKPADIIRGARVALFRHQEIYGIHPAPPEGKQWAADVIDSSPRLEVEK